MIGIPTAIPFILQGIANAMCCKSHENVVQSKQRKADIARGYIMIISVRIENYLVYSSSVDFSLLADKRIRRFGGSVADVGGFSVLKAACVYGANNVGKSCTIRAIDTIKNALSGKETKIVPNIFSGDSAVSLGISFTVGEKAYSFDFTYDESADNSAPRGFIRERLLLLDNKNGRYGETELYSFDAENGELKIATENGETVGTKNGGATETERAKSFKVEVSATETQTENEQTERKILHIFSLSKKFGELKKYCDILESFSESVEWLDMTTISLKKTVAELKNGGKRAKLINEFLKNADLEIEEIFYDDSEKNSPISPKMPIYDGVAPEDVPRLYTMRRGVKVRSDVYDSSGTKKIIAAASYFVEALSEGKTLVIDELDSGLHFKLTRAVVALFNNPLCERAQLIFTTHDVTLLDCKNLFRKDQIWFAAKDADGEYLYSLDDFDDCGSAPDIKTLYDKYKAGMLGALPEPNLVSVILKGGEEDDE